MIEPEHQIRAIFEAMADLVKPTFIITIREVLERNESIVDQHEQSLEYLTNEIADALFRPLDHMKGTDE